MSRKRPNTSVTPAVVKFESVTQELEEVTVEPAAVEVTVEPPVTDESEPIILQSPPSLEQHKTNIVLSDDAKYYLRALLSQYVGDEVATSTVGAHVATVEAGFQLVVFNNPLRVEASDLLFYPSDASTDIVCEDVILNLSRQLVNVRLHP
jgi:hypothetical protein